MVQASEEIWDESCKVDWLEEILRHFRCDMSYLAFRIRVKKYDEIFSVLKKSNKIQQYADIYLLLNYSACFGLPSRPSSGVHKTVVSASGTGEQGSSNVTKQINICVQLHHVRFLQSRITMHGTTNIKFSVCT